MTAPFSPAFSPGAQPKANGAELVRKQLERALAIADANASTLANKIAQAAEAAGVDLLFTLPAPDGEGMAAIVRLSEDGSDRFLQIRATESGVSIAEADEIDPNLLSLARTSVEVLQRMVADQAIRAPLSQAS